MPYCKNCGKEIKEGEICDCQENNSSVKVAVNNSTGKMNFKEIAINVLHKFKGILPNNTVTEIESSSNDNSLLWVFTFVTELLLMSISIGIVISVIIGKMSSLVDNLLGFEGLLYTLGISGVGFFIIFFRSILVQAIVFLCIVLLTWLFTRLFDKKKTFNNVANTISVILIPLTATLVLSCIISLIVPTAAIFLITVAFIFTVFLNYIGVKKLCSMDDEIVWYYLCYVIVILILFSLFH